MARKKTVKRRTSKAKAKKPARKAAQKPARPKAKKTAGRKVAAPKPKAAPPKPQPAKAAPPSGPPAVPNAMGLVSAHVDYLTHNFEEVRRFYTQQLGFTQFEHYPDMNYLFVQTTASSSLGFMPHDPHRPRAPMPPREPTLYFMVRDVDEAYRKLQTRGVSFESPPQDMPWGHRVVTTRDPEGRMIMLAQSTRKG